ncbi:MAG: class I SAM-dependent methyltransferase [Bdellovibrionia bacterium]
MLSTTISKLRCPSFISEGEICQGEVALLGKGGAPQAFSGAAQEIASGTLFCQNCQTRYPILAGVAVLTSDVASYILHHVKGISQLVSEDEIPVEYREDFIDAKSEIEAEHIEEDLEAERVVSLYLMNHYLRVGDGSQGTPAWLKPEQGGTVSPLIESLIREHWDRGPFSQISQWFNSVASEKPKASVIELGSGVGGIYPLLKAKIGSYLGIDSSFASVALARHLALGAPYGRKVRVPGDLLQGPVSREVDIPIENALNGSADFIVGEIESFPVQIGQADVTIALNAIDMMPEPALLPELQYKLLKKGGIAIQSCPYIWHEQVARDLRERIPATIRDSAQAVEWLYTQAGFTMSQKVEHLPWLFFKHLRQLEIYSVHIFMARA